VSQTNSEFDPLWSTDKVAELFDVKPETVRNWIDQGKIKAIKLNGYWRIRRSEVIRYGNANFGS
jgi:excisionase family DNA binding protein